MLSKLSLRIKNIKFFHSFQKIFNHNLPNHPSKSSKFKNLKSTNFLPSITHTIAKPLYHILIVLPLIIICFLSVWNGWTSHTLTRSFSCLSFLHSLFLTLKKQPYLDSGDRKGAFGCIRIFYTWTPSRYTDCFNLA